MLDEYYIVSKEILPKVFHKVLEAKKIIQQGKVGQVSEAVKKVQISRSTFYKYKDHVFEANDNSYLQRKALIFLTLEDEKGNLSKVLNMIYAHKCNIITINQNIPINNQAGVVLSIDVKDMDIKMKKLLNKLSQIEGVTETRLASIE